MIINTLSDSVRYTGRWSVDEKTAVTTAPGAYFELAFKGETCDLHFDTAMNLEPRPHIYIQVDNGAKIEATLDLFIKIEAQGSGNHVAKITFKSAMEAQQRWHEPLIGKIAFCDAQADGEGVLPEDNRKIIEFIGDSITEGIWADAYPKDVILPHTGRQRNMVYENNSTVTYAYLTAEALDMRPYVMGYGAVGITKGGNGGVPRVYEAYPYCYAEKPIEPSGAEIIVINHGANDHLANPDDYIAGYEQFLNLVRERNPESKIVALTSYYGVCEKELGELIERYNKAKNDNITFIPTSGWLPKQPTHPPRSGHKIAAEKLTAILKKLL